MQDVCGAESHEVFRLVIVGGGEALVGVEKAQLRVDMGDAGGHLVGDQLQPGLGQFKRQGALFGQVDQGAFLAVPVRHIGVDQRKAAVGDPGLGDFQHQPV